jgi:hypothetical protein
VAGVSPPPGFTVDDTIEVMDEDGNIVTFIPAAAEGSIGGAVYEVADLDVITGQSYWYVLVEVEQDGDERLFLDDMRQAWALDATPTPTPISLSSPTPQPSATPLPGSTATSSPTPSPSPTGTLQGTTTAGSPTATPSAQATGTGQATATPPPTTASGGVVPPAPTGPTPTRFTFGGGGSDTAEAAEIAQVTAEPDAYPGGDAEGIVEEGAYPAQQIEGGAATAYPEGFTGSTAPSNSGAVNGIGSEAYSGAAGDAGTVGGGAGTTSAALDGNSAQSDGGSQSLLLWLGFLVALVIFAAGMFGSILLFTRRQSPTTNT